MGPATPEWLVCHASVQGTCAGRRRDASNTTCVASICGSVGGEHIHSLCNSRLRDSLRRRVCVSCGSHPVVGRAFRAQQVGPVPPPASLSGGRWVTSSSISRVSQRNQRCPSPIAANTA